MTERFHVFTDFVRPWTGSIISVLLLVCAWVICGIIGSDPFFDQPYIDHYHLLNKNLLLAFIAAALGVQIPVFILFLETMKKSGYVYSTTLPEVTEFRETLALLFSCTILVLLSPREAYLYLVAVVFVLVNLVAIVRALDVIFRIDSYERRLRAAIAKWVRGAFRELLKGRVVANKNYDWIKSTEGMNLTVFGRDDDPTVVVKAKKAGYVNDLRKRYISLLLKLMTKLNGETTLDFLPLFGSRLEKGNDLIAIKSKPTRSLKFWEAALRRGVKISDADYRLMSLNKVLDEFENRLQAGVNANNEKSLDESLKFYSAITDELDDQITRNMVEKDVGYDMEQAFKDTSKSFLGDNLGKVINRTYEVLESTLEKSIKLSKYEPSREILNWAYSSLYRFRWTNNFSALARAELLILRSISMFIYEDVWNSNMTGEQQKIQNYMLDRLTEDTSLMTWDYKGLKEDKQKERISLILKRVENIRSLSLGAYKNNRRKVYKELVSALIQIDKNSDRGLETNDLSEHVSLNIFMLAAYLKHRNDLSSEYAEALMHQINTWAEDKLTRVAIESVNDDIADKWRIDTVDLPADGTMHSVPNYDLVVKGLWIDLMIQKNTIIDRTEYYGEEKYLQETMFFTNGASKHENMDVLKMAKEHTDTQNKNDLVKLIEKFIDIRLKYENEFVSKASLDEEKVTTLRDKANDSFKESAAVLEIFNSGRSYKIEKSASDSNFKQFAVNTLFDKQAFMKEDWHVGYSMDYQGRELGENIARGLDRAIFTDLLSNVQTIKSLDEIIAKARQFQGEWVVFVNKAFNYDFRQEINSIMTESSTYNEQFIKGINQKVPVKRVYADSLPGGLYLVKKSQIGKIIQKRTKSSEYIDVDIQAFSDNDDLMQHFLESQPDWLLEKGNDETQKEYLLTKVRLYAAYVFKYNPFEGREILHYPIEEDE